MTGIIGAVGGPYVLKNSKSNRIETGETSGGIRRKPLRLALQTVSPGAWSIESRPPRAVRRLRPQGAAQVAWVHRTIFEVFKFEFYSASRS